MLLRGTWSEADEARSRELHYTVIWKSKQSDISASTNFFSIAHTTKIILFHHIMDILDEPAQPGPIQPKRFLTGYFEVCSKNRNINNQQMWLQVSCMSYQIMN